MISGSSKSGRHCVRGRAVERAGLHGASARLLGRLRGWGEVITFDMHFALKEQNALTSDDCCRNAEGFSSTKLIEAIHHLVKHK